MLAYPAATFDWLTSGAGDGGASARVRDHVRFIPYREAPRSGMRLQCACNRFHLHRSIGRGAIQTAIQEMEAL